MSMENNKLPKGFASRRDFLFEAGQGLSGVALAWMLGQEGALAAGCGGTEAVASPFLPKKPHFGGNTRAIF